MYFLHPIDRPRPRTLAKVARLYAPATGIALDVHTDEACMQFYTGSALDGSCIGKNNLPYERYAGVCFECQGYPDATRHPEWGEIMVRPGQDQWRHTEYVFTASAQS
jgi:aldose 1-epimerase